MPPPFRNPFVQAKLLGQNPSGDDAPVLVDSSGRLDVVVSSVPLPPGASTDVKLDEVVSATQAVQTSIDSVKKDGSASIQSTDLGFLTESRLMAKQGTIHAFVNFGQQVASASLPVVIASDQTPLRSDRVLSVNSATLTNVGETFTLDFADVARTTFSLLVVSNGPLNWTIDLEVSLDGVNWTAILSHNKDNPGSGKIVFDSIPRAVRLVRARVSSKTGNGNFTVIIGAA